MYVFRLAYQPANDLRALELLEELLSTTQHDPCTLIPNFASQQQIHLRVSSSHQNPVAHLPNESDTAALRFDSGHEADLPPGKS